MASSDIVIEVEGNDITTAVLYAECSFESQMGAIPGTFQLTVKDDAQIYSFVTGDEVSLSVDGTLLYGGYVTQVSEKFAFPVVDSTTPEDVTARQWVLRGVDFNILFDKRVLRNTSNYLNHLGTFPAGSMTGALLRDNLPTFIDIPAGFDVTTEVDDVVTGNPTSVGQWKEQGSTWRSQMETFARWGAVYYINAAKFLIYKAVEDSEAHWGFSDVPNRLPIPVGYGYEPTVGFREGEFVEDGTLIVNDALVWGGSEWSDGIVFARRQNTTSINEHKRWQLAETHFGDLKSQDEVDARANVIVDGTVSGTSGSLTRGLVNPQRTARLTWFHKDVPTDPNASNARSHLRPGDVVDFIMYTLGTDVAHPLIMTLPLRSVRISFPGLDPNGDAYVKFEGYFGLQLSDPWWLWRYIRSLSGTSTTQIVATADDTSTTVAYGTIGSFVPTPDPDGSTTTFTIPFAYIGGTTEIYKNGLRQFPSQVSESDPSAGEVEFVTAPLVGDQLYIIARLTGG